MCKRILSMAAILSICLLSSCSSDSINEITTNAIDTVSDKVITETKGTTDVSVNSDVPKITSTADDIDFSYEYNYLNDMGIYQLTENDIIWNYYLNSDYTYKSDYMPKTVKIDNQTYVELSVATRDDVLEKKEEIQNVFGVELTLSDDNTYYLCPFSSLKNLKDHMKATYSENYINYFLSYLPVTEYDDSLYVTDAGKAISNRKAISVTINEESESNIIFTIVYDLLAIEDCYQKKQYCAIYENDKWVLDSVQNILD